jgi:hypothetical protein
LHHNKNDEVMPIKTYQIPDSAPMTVAEPTVAYGRDAARRVFTTISSSDEWNPNVPFHGTQEEWWEHFHRIEEGEFMTIEEADEKFEVWKRKLLASRM